MDTDSKPINTGQAMDGNNDILSGSLEGTGPPKSAGFRTQVQTQRTKAILKIIKTTTKTSKNIKPSCNLTIKTTTIIILAYIYLFMCMLAGITDCQICKYQE